MKKQHYENILIKLKKINFEKNPSGDKTLYLKCDDTQKLIVSFLSPLKAEISSPFSAEAEGIKKNSTTSILITKQFHYI